MILKERIGIEFIQIIKIIIKIISKIISYNFEYIPIKKYRAEKEA